MHFSPLTGELFPFCLITKKRKESHRKYFTYNFM